jgi:hypothetical protein
MDHHLSCKFRLILGFTRCAMHINTTPVSVFAVWPWKNVSVRVCNSASGFVPPPGENAFPGGLVVNLLYVTSVCELQRAFAWIPSPQELRMASRCRGRSYSV